VVRQGEYSSNYSSKHSVHAAIAAILASEVLNWDEEAQRSAVRVALTMNLAMAELQNQLVSQVTPLTTTQREQVRTHPIRTVELLKDCGISDQEWINGVLQHHEREDASGYPFGITEISHVARLVSCADSFTAKFSVRAGRTSLRSDSAVRQTFAQGNGDAIASALIKAFGLYPPGTAVLLKSGETGLSIKVGETATAPIVVSLTNRSGDHRMTPITRDTKCDEFAVVKAVPYSSLRVIIPFDRLIAAYKGVRHTL
jgi:HD-GYP domain-containing protein (c-di-GMP phosphodiesterase class II)